MIADVLFNGLLQKQLADAIPEHTEDGFQRFTKDLGQEVSGVLALQIAAIELNCFVNEVILRRATVQLVVVLHLAPCRVIQPNGMTAFFLCFYGVHPLQKTKSAKIVPATTAQSWLFPKISANPLFALAEKRRFYRPKLPALRAEVDALAQKSARLFSCLAACGSSLRRKPPAGGFLLCLPFP